MNEVELASLFRRLSTGELQPQDALAEWRKTLCDTTEDALRVRLDLDRGARLGFPEVIFGEGKELVDLLSAVEGLEKSGVPIMVTRVSKKAHEALEEHWDQGEWSETARVWRMGLKTAPQEGRVAVLSGGSADARVAEEAALTAEAWGLQVERAFDVGVAGLHRVLATRELLDRSDMVIVVAGMEGALPSVVGGLYSGPIIAVPTSIGYGVQLGGLTALFAQLSSCAPGVVVVNIDNGFGAGYAAGRWLAGRAKTSPKSDS